MDKNSEILTLLELVEKHFEWVAQYSPDVNDRRDQLRRVKDLNSLQSLRKAIALIKQPKDK